MAQAAGIAMAQHLEALAAQPKVCVQEKMNLIEALSAIIGQEIEMGNKYAIKTEGGEELFMAVEETNCILRQVKQCFPDCTPWKVDIMYTQGGANQKVFEMERPFSCTCCCFNRPVVNMTDVTTGEKIGSIKDPFACCDLTFAVLGPDGSTALKANGGCCQWGLCCPLPCGPCAEVNFPVTDANSGDEVGKLQKKVPGCCKFFLAPDVDNFNVEFGEVQSPQFKALLIGLAIFMDFRYFNENPNDDNGGIMGAMSGGGGDDGGDYGGDDGGDYGGDDGGGDE